MKLKLCYTCKEKLPPTTKFFYRDKRQNDGLTTVCKSCRSIYLRQYYKDNKNKLDKQSRVRRIKIRRLRTLFLLTYLQKHGCVDCKEKDPVCLEFDHVEGKKFMGISEMVNQTYSEKRIIKEIEKCEVRCSNCHRKKTAKEYGWYNYIDLESMQIKHNRAKPKPRTRHLQIR